MREGKSPRPLAVKAAHPSRAKPTRFCDGDGVMECGGSDASDESCRAAGYAVYLNQETMPFTATTTTRGMGERWRATQKTFGGGAMGVKQTIWSLDEKRELSFATLINENELESLIADNINLLSDDWLLVGRQVRTLYGGIIDLLCIDIAGNPVVVELKKNMTPREVTAQALDYASWVKSIDAEELAQLFLKHTNNQKSLDEAYKERFGFPLDGENDDTDVKVIIVATDMDGSTERIINYLKDYGIDINVLTFRVFEHEGKRLLSRAWMFEENQAVPQRDTSSGRTWNGEYYFSFGADSQRSWNDAVEYGFVSAGGGSRYTGPMSKLEPGNRIWINMPKIGYVGVGIVKERSILAHEATFEIDDNAIPFFELKLQGEYHKNLPVEKAEYIVKVDWVKIVPQSNAVSEYGFFGNQQIVSRPKAEKWEFTIKRLKELWNIV